MFSLRFCGHKRGDDEDGQLSHRFTVPNVIVPTTSAIVRMAKAPVDCVPESPLLAVSSFAALAKAGRGKVRQVGAPGYPLLQFIERPAPAFSAITGRIDMTPILKTSIKRPAVDIWPGLTGAGML